MNCRDRLCLFSMRAEGLLVDFVAVFLVRWILLAAGLEYVYITPMLGKLPPVIAPLPLMTPAGEEFYGTMLFSSGLPEIGMAVLWAVYAIAAISLTGHTLGMWFAGVRLVNERGRTPGVLRVAARHLLSPLSAVYWLGYLMVMLAPAPAALHDFITRTRVISGEGYSSCRPYNRR